MVRLSDLRSATKSSSVNGLDCFENLKEFTLGTRGNTHSRFAAYFDMNVSI